MSEKMSTYPIRRVIEHSPGLKSFYFYQDFDAVPGQFIELWIPGVDEKPFSISDLSDGLLEISVKAVGPFTERIMSCDLGDYLGVRGPFGRGFKIVDNALLVGGGIGAAPLRFLARVLAREEKEFVFLVGAKSKEDVIFSRELSKYRFYCTTEDGSFGRPGLVTEEMERIMAKDSFACIYASGPEAMLIRVMEMAEARSVPFQISFERYMKCGIGLCGQCCMDGSGIRLCVDGPVLTQDAVRGITEIGLPHRDATGCRPRPT